MRIHVHTSVHELGICQRTRQKHDEEIMCVLRQKDKLHCTASVLQDCKLVMLAYMPAKEALRNDAAQTVDIPMCERASLCVKGHKQANFFA